MSDALLNVGDILLDYSYALHDDAAQLQATLAEAKIGASGFIRYSAGAASDPSHPSHGANRGKLITPAEYKAIVAAGFDIVANSEWYETRVTEGRQAGLEDGRADADLWRSCGHPKGATVYVSWDAVPSALRYLKVRRYLKAWREGAQGYYEPDLYAGTKALRALRRASRIFRIRYGWRPNAGSWSNDGLPYQPRTATPAARAALAVQAQKATPAHIWQTGNYWFGHNADESLVVRTPLGSRNDTLAERPTPTPAPAPAPTPTPVPVEHAPAPTIVARTSDDLWSLVLLGDGSLVMRRDGKHVGTVWQAPAEVVQ